MLCLLILACVQIFLPEKRSNLTRQLFLLMFIG